MLMLIIFQSTRQALHDVGGKCCIVAMTWTTLDSLAMRPLFLLQPVLEQIMTKMDHRRCKSCCLEVQRALDNEKQIMLTSWKYYFTYPKVKHSRLTRHSTTMALCSLVNMASTLTWRWRLLKLRLDAAGKSAHLRGK
jgi:hypothetical protein